MTLSAFQEKMLNRVGFKITRLKMRDDLDIYSEVYGKDILNKKCFLNIGSGIFRHKLWVNLDHYSKRYRQNIVDVDIDLSISPKLPFQNNSFLGAYTSHTIEHLDIEAVENIFTEVWRVLSPNGIFRVTTPDADFVFENKYFSKYIDANYNNYFYGGKTNNRPESHRSSWNENKLKKLFDDNNFSTSYRSEYGKSKCPVMCNVDYFDNTHPWLSIYFEGKK